MDFANKTSAQILNDAADTLERGNWVQGTFVKVVDNQPCFCAHGAIQYCGNKAFYDAVEKKNLDAAADAAVTDVQNIAHQYARGVGLSYFFNDTSDRTKEEVIAKLREAAQVASLGKLQNL